MIPVLTLNETELYVLAGGGVTYIDRLPQYSVLQTYTGTVRNHYSVEQSDIVTSNEV